MTTDLPLQSEKPMNLEDLKHQFIKSDKEIEAWKAERRQAFPQDDGYYWLEWPRDEIAEGQQPHAEPCQVEAGGLFLIHTKHDQRRRMRVDSRGFTFYPLSSPCSPVPPEQEDPHPGYDCGGTCAVHRFAIPAATPAPVEQELAHQCEDGKFRPFASALCSMCRTPKRVALTVRELCDELNRATPSPSLAREAAEIREVLEGFGPREDRYAGGLCWCDKDLTDDRQPHSKHCERVNALYAKLEPPCTCTDLTEVQRAQGDHYDDCPRSTWRKDQPLPSENPGASLRE